MNLENFSADAPAAGVEQDVLLDPIEAEQARAQALLDSKTLKVRDTDLIAKKFFVPLSIIRQRIARKIWLKGGRGSTKSSFAALTLLMELEADTMASAVIIRKVGATMRDSVFSNMKWAAEKLGLSTHWKFTVSPMMGVHMKTGQVILFRGLDDPEKAKSLKPERGYFKVVWFEELTEFDGLDEIRNVLQSVIRGGEECLQLYSYNPPKDPRAWVNEETEKKTPDRYVHTSSYLDVPVEWLGQPFIDEAMALLAKQPLAYDHEYLGLAVGNSDQIVLSGKYIVEDFEPQPEWDGPYFGLDFGFANDPSALIKMWIDAKNWELNIECEAYEQHVELNHYKQFIEGGVTEPDVITGERRTFVGIEGASKHKIMCDSARPDIINLIKKDFSMNAEGAEKGPGSVEDGIAFLRGFNIIRIHSRCINTIKEARNYSYKVDRLTKEVMPVTVDRWNHAWDAVRYALVKLIKKRKGLWDIV